MNFDKVTFSVSLCVCMFSMVENNDHKVRKSLRGVNNHIDNHYFFSKEKKIEF